MLSRHWKVVLLGTCAALFGWVASVALPVPASAQQKSDPKAGPLYVVTYVDVFPNFAEDTLKAMRQFAADSRKDPGSVRFEFLRDVERTNHFSIVEVWQNRQAYEAHLNQAHSKSFREKIQPGLGSPFDERLYFQMQ
jgi:quinol monooxygenase YgiN